MEAAGQFDPILAELKEAATDPLTSSLKFVYGKPSSVELNYQEPPPPGLTPLHSTPLHSTPILPHALLVPDYLRWLRTALYCSLQLPLYHSTFNKGKRTGRYIDQPDLGDVTDVHTSLPVMMRDGRELQPPASLQSVQHYALLPVVCHCVQMPLRLASLVFTTLHLSIRHCICCGTLR